jgi:hypothetical protein
MKEETRHWRVESVPPAQMPEVLRLATEIYTREQSQLAEAEQCRNTVQAAIELGLPADTLDRAATIVAEQQAEREVAHLQRKGRRRRSAALMALSMAAGIAIAGSYHQENRRRTFPAPSPPYPAGAALALVPPAAPVPLIGPCTEVDLSPYVTQRLDEPMLPTPGNDLRNLLAGLPGDGASHRIMHGIPFRLNGVVLVGPGEAFSGNGAATPVPPQVEGIAVDHQVKRLHFLHGTHWRARDGMQIGAYIVHYADGTRLEIPIRYGEEVRDWWVRSDPNPRVTQARVAWRGSNEATDRIRLYLCTWENPYPRRAIQTLDMVTGLQAAGRETPVPFLVGLTAEQESSVPTPAPTKNAKRPSETP